jgi:hypothetical protein
MNTTAREWGTPRVTDTQFTDGNDIRAIQPEPEFDEPLLSAEIVVARDAPAECTVVPRDATVSDQLSCWIRAEGEGFVSLESMR